MKVNIPTKNTGDKFTHSEVNQIVNAINEVDEAIAQLGYSVSDKIGVNTFDADYITDLDNLTKSSLDVYGVSIYEQDTFDSNDGTLYVSPMDSESAYVSQLFVSSKGTVYARSNDNDRWSDWVKMATMSDLDNLPYVHKLNKIVDFSYLIKGTITLLGEGTTFDDVYSAIRNNSYIICKQGNYNGAIQTYKGYITGDKQVIELAAIFSEDQLSQNAPFSVLAYAMIEKLQDGTVKVTRRNDINLIQTNDIVDHLKSPATDKALSANQGRVLDEKKADIIKVNGLYKLKNNSTQQEILSALGLSDINQFEDFLISLKSAYVIDTDNPSGQSTVAPSYQVALNMGRKKAHFYFILDRNIHEIYISKESNNTFRVLEWTTNIANIPDEIITDIMCNTTSDTFDLVYSYQDINMDETSDKIVPIPMAQPDGDEDPDGNAGMMSGADKLKLDSLSPPLVLGDIASINTESTPADITAVLGTPKSLRNATLAGRPIFCKDGATQSLIPLSVNVASTPIFISYLGRYGSLTMLTLIPAGDTGWSYIAKISTKNVDSILDNSQVVNSLNSDSQDMPLSANMGKELKTLVDSKIDKTDTPAIYILPGDITTLTGGSSVADIEAAVGTFAQVDEFINSVTGSRPINVYGSVYGSSELVPIEFGVKYGTIYLSVEKTVMPTPMKVKIDKFTVNISFNDAGWIHANINEDEILTDRNNTNKAYFIPVKVFDLTRSNTSDEIVAAFGNSELLNNLFNYNNHNPIHTFGNDATGKYVSCPVSRELFEDGSLYIGIVMHLTYYTHDSYRSLFMERFEGSYVVYSSEENPLPTA